MYRIINVIEMKWNKLRSQMEFAMRRMPSKIECSLYSYPLHVLIIWRYWFRLDEIFSVESFEQIKSIYSNFKCNEYSAVFLRLSLATFLLFRSNESHGTMAKSAIEIKREIKCFLFGHRSLILCILFCWQICNFVYNHPINYHLLMWYDSMTATICIFGRE